MKKIAVFTTLIALTLSFGGVVYAADEQYHGGAGSGYAMGECTGRLDAIVASPQSHQARETTQYRGGPGGGYAMGEYVGPIDESKKQPQERTGGLRNIISRFFKRRSQ